MSEQKPPERESEQEPKQQTPPGTLQIFSSVFSAAFGVQSSKNHERDFKHGKARVFIIAGITFTLLFIATVFSVVRMVLAQTGH
jgi:hypothetical protein